MNKANAGSTMEASQGSTEQIGSVLRGWEVPKTINFTLVSTLGNEENDDTVYNQTNTNFMHKNAISLILQKWLKTFPVVF